MNRIYICIMFFCMVLPGCISTDKVLNQTNNFYFFLTERVDVKCEMNILHMFSGDATLQVNKLSETRLDNYYELILTDLRGHCDSHVDISEPDCEFSMSFPIGYLYVDNEHIFLMPYDKGYLAIFNETDVFPPAQEYIDNWNGKIEKAKEHYGCFNYRLVCSEEGFDDTFGTLNGIDEYYHNFISVDGDERHYNLWPEASGTQEYMFIFWKKDKGIVYFSNWSGNLKNYISFYDSLYEEKSIIELIP